VLQYAEVAAGLELLNDAPAMRLDLKIEGVLAKLNALREKVGARH